MDVRINMTYGLFGVGKGFVTNSVNKNIQFK